MMHLVTLSCQCCGEALLCPWGVVQTGKIVEKVSIAVHIPWQECPNCGYTLESLRFRSPEIGLKHKNVPEHPGMKGLKR